jgi:hypothetical protein
VSAVIGTVRLQDGHSAHQIGAQVESGQWLMEPLVYDIEGRLDQHRSTAVTMRRRHPRRRVDQIIYEPP